MNISEINQKYTSGDLASCPGDGQFRYEVFSPLFNNLFENKVVYHERFTCIVKLEDIEITPDWFSAKAIPYLLIEKGNRMDRFFPKKPWNIFAKWSFLRLINTCLTPYSSWLMWADPEIVEKLVLQKNYKEALNLTLYEE